MQEKIRKIIPYILIGMATIVAVLIYLLTANKRKEYSLYLFDRTFRKDNVPPPSIIKYQDYYLYERGKAFNTNMAAFVHKNRFYAFSLKTSSHLTQFLLDCYDINNNEYLYSFYIDNASHEENLYIEDVTVKGDTVTIESRNSTTIIGLL